MTAELMFKFISQKDGMRTERYMIVDDADLAEKMVMSQAINAVAWVSKMMNGSDEGLYPFNPEEIAKVRKEFDDKSRIAHSMQDTVEKLTAYAIEANEKARNYLELLSAATDKLEYIADGNLSKKHAVSVAQSGVAIVQERMKEYRERRKDDSPQGAVVSEPTGTSGQTATGDRPAGQDNQEAPVDNQGVEHQDSSSEATGPEDTPSKQEL